MLTWVFAVCLGFVCLFVLDDLFIDLCAFLKGLKPREIKKDELEQIQKISEKNIAIIVGNWQEFDVIGRMVSGNLKQIQYKNYHFFLGVYPNDPLTAKEVEALVAVHSNVHVVTNKLEGPTSKGQMLNQIVQGVWEHEAQQKTQFDIFLLQDSEDILHPLSLRLVNWQMDRADFLQVPVFSFYRGFFDWVGAVYQDEFAELHTKDLLVRESLGASVPSAGVGTALTRKLVLGLLEKQNGELFVEKSLTEDYVLGMNSQRYGFKAAFGCYYIRDANNQKDFIATREYFPNRLRASVRQKTRWVLGIVFQGTQMIPLQGSFMNRYFLYRDRRGPFNSVFAMLTTVLTIYILFQFFDHNLQVQAMMSCWWFQVGSVVATIGMLSRALHRLKAVAMTNGFAPALVSVLRWPFGNFVNFLASVKATWDFLIALVFKKPLRWTKTQHSLPDGFGENSGT